MSEEPPIYDPYVAPPRREPSPVASPSSPPETSGMAIAATTFGVLGFVCMPVLGGMLALILGVAARAEIQRSEGAKTGNGLAIGGAVLGGVNVLVSVLGLALFFAFLDRPATVSTPVSPPVVAPPSPIPSPLPTGTSPAPPSSATAASGGSSRQGGVVVTRIGSIDLVDVDREVKSLPGELDTQRALAAKDGKRLLLWVVVKDCQPCNGVAASLPDAKMQNALEKVRVLRVDAGDFGPELTFLGIPSAKVPGFALMGESNRPTDYVNGGEWDEDVARNIAPVLGNFVRGRYPKRREPWHGGRRDDETTL